MFKPVFFLMSLAAVQAPLIATAATQSSHSAHATPQQKVEELLSADRAFSAASAGLDTASALSAMFDEGVRTPLPNATFTSNKAEAIAALRANPFNLASKAEWAPVRGGISADGQHGFTYGFMTLTGNDGEVRKAKYLAYWIKRPEGWRIAAYKRAGRPDGEISLDMLPPAIPSALVAPNSDSAVMEAHEQGLRRAEKAFSDEAQRIGLGPAFRNNGSADSMNMGGGPGFTIGNEAIGEILGAQPGPGVTWDADDAIVASSGDLGVTFGLIRPNGPIPEGSPAAFPFFTIWRRAGPDQPWRYIAE